MSQVAAYRISVQWGCGPHYFIYRPYLSKEEAVKQAKNIAEGLVPKYRRGALPVVRVHECVYEILVTRAKLYKET